jgi:hypothetical protein
MFTNNPRIVTDGIKGCWDPLMPDTATSATLLYEQVGSGVDGTMYNGGCLDVDGTNDYVLNSSFTDHQSSSGTIVVWANADSLSGGTYTFGVGGTVTYGATRAMRFYLSKLSLVGFGSGGVQDYNDFGPTLVTGQWYHVAYVWSGTSVTGYVDGVGYSTTLSGLVTPTGTNVTAGQAPWGGGYFNGQVADARVYNVALSAANIKELYDDSKIIIPTKNDASGGFVAQTNLKGHWPLSEGAGTLCYDGSGNGNTGTMTNMDAATDWLTGQTGAPQLVEGYNRKAVFEDSTDYVLADNAGITGDLSVSAWIYRFSDTLYYAGVVAKMGASSGSNGWMFRFDSSHQLEFMLQRSGVFSGEGSVTLSNNTWHHVVGTNDGTNLKVYLDGSLGSTVSSGGATTDSGTKIQIGTYGYAGSNPPPNTYPFYGIVDEVIIYNSALTLAQVQVLAATGPNGGPLPPDPMSLSNSSDINGYWRNDGNVTWADRSSGSNTATVYGSPDALLFKQGYNGSGSTSAGRDGQGFPLLFQNNGAIGFNGSSDYVAIGNDTPTQIGGLGSLEAWVFQAENKWMYFYSKGYNAANSLFLGFHTTGGGKWFFGSYYGSTYKYFYWTGVGQSDYAASFANRWHYLTMTYDKTLGSDNWKVYHNGVYAAATDYTTDLGTTTIAVQVGNGGRGWVGQIGPIKLYDRVLSPSEITQNFNAQRSRFGI